MPGSNAPGSKEPRVEPAGSNAPGPKRRGRTVLSPKAKPIFSAACAFFNPGIARRRCDQAYDTSIFTNF